MDTPVVAITRRARSYSVAAIATEMWDRQVDEADVICFCSCFSTPHAPSTCCHSNVWQDCTEDGMCGTTTECRSACRSRDIPIVNSAPRRRRYLQGA